MDINLTDTSKGTTVSSATVSSWKKQQHQSQTRPISTDTDLMKTRFAGDTCSPCDIYKRRGFLPPWRRCCRPRGRGGGGAPWTHSAQTHAAEATNTSRVRKSSQDFFSSLVLEKLSCRPTWAPGCSSPRATSVSRGGAVSSHSLEPSRLT